MNLYVVLMVLLPVVVSIGAVRWIYFKILKVAKDKNLVDNPESRKLQKAPVPVVGGLAVFFGFVSGLLVGCAISNVFASELSAFPLGVSLSNMLPVILGMSVMLYTGCMDDVSGLSPRVRLIIEVLAISLLVVSTGTCADSLHGLWGIGQLPIWVALPLTVFAGAGIINAVNMMDGVNGLSSGICISCSMLCGVHFAYVGDWANALLAFCMAASLVLFFVHNVFGNTSRMFIGDAGTMVLGMLMAWFVVSIMHNGSLSYVAVHNICPTAMVLALFSVPVADTLRVMSMRIVNGRSPFSPDKTHLHHAFVACGISHSITTLSEILVGLAVVALWTVSVWLDASYEMQFYLVVLVSAILVWGTYFFLVHAQKSNSCMARWLRVLSMHTHLADREWWQRFSFYLDAPELTESERKDLKDKLKRKFYSY